ncbi:MAG: hypothetical protein QY327_01765 [Fimbriimonadaceae bacterium]|nr:MAG: hypothetical protein UZ18_ATM001002333 [Armatimonadetes bacterium OLB18]WKZ80628.1 MAG: hypothetical protein QY327_01765 [Fimbriimonadaceae bacterium]
MSTTPKTIQGILDFYAVRQPVWAANTAKLGISAAQATQLGTYLTDAQTAQDAVVRLRDEAKTATEARDVELSELTEFGSALIAVIKGTAQSTGDDTVYTTAMLPVPGTGGGSPSAPSMPGNLVGEILNTGDVQLRWSSSGRNVFYTIWRKLSTESGFHQIGATQGRVFTDEGAEAAQWSAYYVIAHRGSFSSDASEVLQVVLPGYSEQQAA